MASRRRLPAVALVVRDNTAPSVEIHHPSNAGDGCLWEPSQKRGFVWVEQPRVSAPGLDALLTWAHQVGASRVSFQTGHPAMIRLYGRNRRVTLAALDEMHLSVIVNHLYGSDGMARLQGGSDFDTAYTVPLSRDLRLRFRLNATPTSTAMRGGVNVVLRPIADMPPSLEAQGVETMILDHYCPRDGIVLVSGGTGSGKSTLIAGLIKTKLEDPGGHYDIVEAAAPVEFLLERVRGPSSSMNQTEVPRDLPTFAAFVRGAMRREPTDIIVGECRDTETMGASIQAAISGHTVTTTVHSNNASLTMQRVASLCPADERDNLISAVAQSLRLIVNQRLLPSTDGKRTAIREILVFDAPLRSQLLRTAPSDWPELTQRAVEERGVPYRASIERALRESRITEAVANGELRQLR